MPKVLIHTGHGQFDPYEKKCHYLNWPRFIYRGIIMKSGQRTLTKPGFLLVWYTECMKMKYSAMSQRARIWDLVKYRKESMFNSV